MIPKELQEKLDSFNKKYQQHYIEEIKKIEDKYEITNTIVKRLDEGFCRGDIEILEKGEWILLRGLLEKSNEIILELRKESGEKCVECQRWIEEKIKRG